MQASKSSFELMFGALIRAGRPAPIRLQREQPQVKLQPEQEESAPAVGRLPVVGLLTGGSTHSSRVAWASCSYHPFPLVRVGLRLARHGVLHLRLPVLLRRQI
jgi:hypothetical protein